MQKIVPSIMHTSRDEKEMVTGPMWNEVEASAMVIITKEMVMDRRLELEKNSFSSWVSSHPMIAPSTSEHTISSIGLTTIVITFSVPPSSACAIPKDTANTIRPTASSSATIGSSRSVTGPLALY